MKKITKSICCFIWSLFFYKKNQNYLFIMGHPRSGSSLLMHILATNKAIIGSGEYFTIYKNKWSIKYAEFDIRRKRNKLFQTSQYIANQVLHISRTPNIELLNSEKIKHVFLIRHPEEALSSAAILSKKNQGFINKSKIVEQYINRLTNLTEIHAKLNANEYYFLTYHDLLLNTESTLSNLSEFLNLKKPLSSKYKIQNFTRKSGDPSVNITNGEIFKTESKRVDFEEKQLLKAIQVYETTCKKLKN